MQTIKVSFEIPISKLGELSALLNRNPIPTEVELNGKPASDEVENAPVKRGRKNRMEIVLPADMVEAAIEQEPQTTSDSSENELPQSPAPSQSIPTISLTLLRQKIAEKITNHRDSMRAELLRLGAPNITLLPETNYGEFLQFLNSLT